MVIVIENERELEIKYDSVCENLDVLIIESFDLQKQLLEKRKAMELVTKSAFFNMAQAKYLLGCTRMSMLQVNSRNMEASVKIQMEEVDSSATFPYSYHSFQLIKPDIKDNSTPNEPERNDGGIRKRKETTKASELKNSSDSEEDGEKINKRTESVDNDIANEIKDIKKEKSNNPLNWFGVLVPECLRDCQKLFQQATELSTEIATLQSKIIQVNKLYQSKRSVKLSTKEI